MAFKTHDDYNILNTYHEVALSEDYTVVTYQVITPTKYIYQFAGAMADEQTTGTWTSVSAETTELKRKFGAKVVDVVQCPDVNDAAAACPDKAYFVTIAFPRINYGFDFPMMLSTLMGNISASGKCKMMDIHFPKSYLDGFKGPKFGIDGLRETLGVQGRPLLNAMIKPNLGWTPEVGAELFYQAAKGGVDVIKDDELLSADMPFCLLKERVTRFMEMEKRVFEETGEHTLYAVNITGEVTKLKENAMRALEYGTNCLMVNYYTVGLSAARALAEDPDINVPVLAHVDFLGVLAGAPQHGMAAHLTMGKLARMAGADFQIFGNPYGKFPIPMVEALKVCHYATQPLYHIKPMMPAISGGTTQASVGKVCEALGTDIIMAAGGAVHGHPDGSYAGAKAMRQAIDAAVKGIPAEEYAKEHEELAKALNLWGLDQSKNFDLMR